MIRLLALCLFCLTAPLPAKAFPDKPLELIVPWQAGGGADAMARIIASLLQRELEQPVGVRNRPDETGVGGHSAIASAAPDGHVIGLITTELGMMHWRGLTELNHTDFTPLALMNVEPAAIQVRAEGPIRTVEELITSIRAKAGRPTGSGSSTGGIWHLASAGFLQSIGIPADAIAWRASSGAAPAYQDLLAGRIELVVSSIPDASALLNAGLVRTLAIMDRRRNPGFPEVPTLKESTGSDWTIAAWRGIAAPAGLPEATRRTLATALKAVFDSPEFTAFMTQRGFTPRYAGPDEFRAFLNASDQALGRALRSAGLAAPLNDE